jgi:hypothetical protein
MHNPIMRRFILVVFVFGLYCGLLPALDAAEYRKTNGDVLRGTPASFTEDGVVFRLDIGGFSDRVSWSHLTQESLKELAKDPQAAALAEPFIEIPPEVKELEKQRKQIVVKPVEGRIERAEKAPFLATFGTPAGILMLAVLYLANLYAAFHIARFRNRPPALVIGTSAVLPVLAPVLFLSLPTGAHPVDEGAAGIAPAGEAAPGLDGAKKTGPAAKSGLGLAAHEKGQKSETSVEVFRRGDTTFNRRFFESKFPGFFRIVPSEAEKDLVLVVRTGKNEYIAKRISRISMNELHLQLLSGGSEVSVTFGEIAEVRARHKDAKA